MSEPRGERPVTALRRPPVRQSTLVRSELAHTFSVFVDTIGTWWPVRPYSRGQDRVADVTVQPRLGGRVYETWDDGTEREWGRLLAWEPPRRLVMSWEITPAATEVELTFAALGPALTRVTVEHRGWEALDRDWLVADEQRPGPCGGYRNGWITVLAALAAAAGGAAPDPAAPDR